MHDTPSAEDVLWSPGPDHINGTVLHRYLHWLETEHGLRFDNYFDLWRWSTDRLEDFWSSIADFFDVIWQAEPKGILASSSMPGAEWFPGACLNYAENALSHELSTPAIVAHAEGRDQPIELSWDQLRGQVGALSAWLMSEGVKPGDRVVGYLPNTVQTVVAFLACAAIGAVWSACAPDYAPDGAADRFAQLEPSVLIVADGYRFGGKRHDRSAENERLRGLLPSIHATLWIDNTAEGAAPGTGMTDFAEVVKEAVTPMFAAVRFDHPLWVLYSSGTTGRPKGIVHGHGGVVLEHQKFLGLHVDLKPSSRYTWFATTSWMVWNAQVSGLLRGATIVLYDGNPAWPDPGRLWQVAAEQRLDFLGTSAAYLTASQRAGIDPGKDYDLSELRGVGSTGSPLPTSTAAWITGSLPNSWLNAASGGTDIVSAFCGGVPILPLRAGEMQGPLLGVALEAWDTDGNARIGDVADLVVTKPMPSMPLCFWADPDGERYQEAYFSTYPGVWRHGDWVTVTERGGVIVHGRSDATMNRHGIRMGSAEIYEVVEQFDAIGEALVVGVEQPDGGYWMPLFVTTSSLEPPVDLEQQVKAAIRASISPRHVPDEVIVVDSLPHTRTGKRLEVPVKRLLQGTPLEKAAALSSVDNPDAMRWFADFARNRRTCTPSGDEHDK